MHHLLDRNEYGRPANRRATRTPEPETTLKTIPKDPRIEYAPCPKLTRPLLRIIVENQCIIVRSQHQPPSPHLRQLPVDGASGIAFASPHKRLCRLAFWHLSTSCDFFASQAPLFIRQGAEKTKRPKATGNGSSSSFFINHDPVPQRDRQVTSPWRKSGLPAPRDASATPRSLHMPSAPIRAPHRTLRA